MKWRVREPWLLLGGLLFAFLVWVPVVINVLPRLVGRDPGAWRWGVEHLPEFFGSQGARHAILSWGVALTPYVVVQVARLVNRSAQVYRKRRAASEPRTNGPDNIGSGAPGRDFLEKGRG